MRIVQVYSGNEIQKLSLSEERWHLLQTLFQGQGKGKNFSRLCCRAGICPLVLQVKKIIAV